MVKRVFFPWKRVFFRGKEFFFRGNSVANWLSLRSFSKLYFSLISRGLLPGRGGAVDTDDSDKDNTDSDNTDSVSSVCLLQVSNPSVSSSSERSSSGVALADFGNGILGEKLLLGAKPIASAQC